MNDNTQEKRPECPQGGHLYPLKVIECDGETDTRNIVGFASERLFVDYTDHAALLRAVANEVKGLHHHPLCNAVYYNDGQKCTCPRGKALAMLEVE